MAQSNLPQKEPDMMPLQRNVSMFPLTDLPMRVPRSAHWHYLALEYHRQPPGECTYSLPHHTLRFALQPYRPFERRSNKGRLLHLSVLRGDLFLCPATSQQWMRWLAPAEFLLMSLHPELLTRLAEEADLSPVSLELVENEQEIQDPLLLQIALALLAETSEQTATLSATYVEALTNALAAHLLKHYCQHSGQTAVTFPPAEQFSAPTLRQVKEYIQEYLGHSLALGELAAVAGMSPYHFTRRFKQSTGLSPHQYILRERIEAAKMLLLKGEPILELTTRLGFADQSHFTRSFKRLVGMTPAAFVRQHPEPLFTLR